MAAFRSPVCFMNLGLIPDRHRYCTYLYYSEMSRLRSHSVSVKVDDKKKTTMNCSSLSTTRLSWSSTSPHRMRKSRTRHCAHAAPAQPSRRVASAIPVGHGAQYRVQCIHREGAGLARTAALKRRHQRCVASCWPRSRVPR